MMRMMMMGGGEEDGDISLRTQGLPSCQDPYPATTTGI